MSQDDERNEDLRYQELWGYPSKPTLLVRKWLIKGASDFDKRYGFALGDSDDLYTFVIDAMEDGDEELRGALVTWALSHVDWSELWEDMVELSQLHREMPSGD